MAHDFGQEMRNGDRRDGDEEARVGCWVVERIRI
jgi:hypothetical protein